MGSYAFTATPGKSGEAVRSLLLKQYCAVPIPPTLLALIVERLTDGIAVLYCFNQPSTVIEHTNLMDRTPGIGLVVLLVGWSTFRSPWFQTQLKKIPKRMLSRKLAYASNDGLIALRQLLRPLLLFEATVIGTVAWSLEGVSLWLLLRGMGVDEVGIGGATVAHTSAGLIGAITLLPGGLGSTEAGTVGLLVLQGVEQLQRLQR